MNSISAQGKINSIEYSIYCYEKDKELVIETDDKIKEKFLECLKNPRPMGGTYIPKENSLLGAYNVIENMIFDDVPVIEISGDIGQIPHEEGIIY